MDQSVAVQLHDRHDLFLGVEHEVGQESVFLVVMFAKAEVFDKVLVSVLEEPLFRTGPRIIGAILCNRHG